MTIEYTPSAGFSYDYWCPACGVFLGNSKDDYVIRHPEAGKHWVKTSTGSVFRENEPCMNHGMTALLPKHQIEVNRLDIGQRIA